MLSLYMHIPFCKSKCPYCDFYSAPQPDTTVYEAYAKAVCARLLHYGEVTGHAAVDTVYFGGGTPSVLPPALLCQMLQAVRQSFSLQPRAEITVECNPADGTADFFAALSAAGFNRVSMGLQSADEKELRLLGRRHSREQVAAAVENARSAGIENLSLDLMLGLPGSATETLLRSAAFAVSLQVPHISSYILKIEPGTPFSRMALQLPEDDDVAQQYLALSAFLTENGYRQYEISNFAKPDAESRHNLKYWHCREYIGIGPAAHSFYRGQRFYYPRDLSAFLAGNAPEADGPGGDFEEYAMLALRLAEGLQKADCAARFPDGAERFSAVLRRAEQLPSSLCVTTPSGISLTPEGFLVSNAILSELL